MGVFVLIAYSQTNGASLFQWGKEVRGRRNPWVISRPIRSPQIKKVFDLRGRELRRSVVGDGDIDFGMHRLIGL